MAVDLSDDQWRFRYPLARPSTLDDEQWRTLCLLFDRLDRARRDQDWEQSVGTAKELCEATAKLVLEIRGHAVGSAIKVPKLIGDAHVALGRQPGADLADAPPIRDMAQAAKNVVLGVNELRLTHGTGHGRARTPDVLLEHAEVAADAALLWVRWALRRLDVMVEGRTTDLLRDLRGATFRQGELARRLIATNIPDLEPSEQRRLGVAVGQRAAKETFNVRVDGVDAATGEGPWTKEYRAGVIEGSFIDIDGHLGSFLPVAQAVIGLIDALGHEAAAVLVDVADRAADAPLSYRLQANTESRLGIAESLDAEGQRFSPPVADGMRRLAALFRNPVESG